MSGWWHNPKPSLQLKISLGINAYVSTFILHFEIGYQSAQFMRKALHYMFIIANVHPYTEKKKWEDEKFFVLT